MIEFILIVAVIASVVSIAIFYGQLQNPRKVWDRKHGGEVKGGGEPTAEALAKIRRNALFGLIGAPILIALAGFKGYLEFERQMEQHLVRWELAERDSPFAKEFGRLSRVSTGMTEQETLAIMGPGQRTRQPDGEYLSWPHSDGGQSYHLYVQIKDGKVARSGRIGPAAGSFWAPPAASSGKQAEPPDPQQLALRRAHEQEQQRLQGTWTLISLETNGKPQLKKDDKQQLLFKGDSWKRTSWGHGPSGNYEATESGVVRFVSVDDDAKSFDLIKKNYLTRLEDAVPGIPNPLWHPGEAVYPAIYRIDGDDLHICQSGASAMNRPREFAAREGDDFTCSVWKRANNFRPDGTPLMLPAAADKPAATKEPPEKKERSLISKRAFLEGHTGEYVRCVAFSADGKTVASGGDDNLVKLWDVASNKEKATLRGHTDEVRGVAFWPDAKTAVSWGLDGTTKLWDIAAAKEKSSLRCFVPVEGMGLPLMAVSTDGKTLALGTEGGMKLVDLESGKDGRRFKGEWSGVDFSHTGKTLALVHGQRVELWDIISDRPKFVLKGDGPLAFAPDDKTVAVGDIERTGKEVVRLYDTATGELKATFATPTEHIMSVVFSPDGKTLAVGRYLEGLQLWDVTAGKLKIELEPTSAATDNTQFAVSLAFSPNGKILASGGSTTTGALFEKGIVRLWDLEAEGVTEWKE